MNHLSKLYKSSISEDLSKELLKILLDENPSLEHILTNNASPGECLSGIRSWIEGELQNSPKGYKFYKHESFDRKAFEELQWKDMASIRILEYLDHEGREFVDLNIRGEVLISKPFTQLWEEVHHAGTQCTPDYYEDILQLFRQFRGELKLNKPDLATITKWMNRWPDGLDEKIQSIRSQNKDRIIQVFIEKMDSGHFSDSKYSFEPNMTRLEKTALVRKWWNKAKFHLKFAVRNPDDLNDYLGNSLDQKTMDHLHKAQDKGIPFRG